MLRSLQVHHEVQMAHRLMNLPGKCQRIHGHSMKVTIELSGELDDRGILIGDLADIKKVVRTYLDNTYDHSLILNEEDPWAGVLSFQKESQTADFHPLPGLVTMVGDPTIENLSQLIANWCSCNFPTADKGRVILHETSTNTIILEWVRGFIDVDRNEPR